jgi:hypothetical protein
VGIRVVLLGYSAVEGNGPVGRGVAGATALYERHPKLTLNPLYACLVEGNGRYLGIVRLRVLRFLLGLDRAFVLLDVFSGREQNVGNRVEPRELAGNEDAVDALDNDRILHFFFGAHESQQRVDRNDSNVPSVAGSTNLCLEIASAEPVNKNETAGSRD